MSYSFDNMIETRHFIVCLFFLFCCIDCSFLNYNIFRWGVFSFRDGDYGTSFIPHQYPHGFHGEKLTDRETLRLVASAAAIHQARGEASHQADSRDEYGYDSPEQTEDDCYVVIKGNDPKKPGVGDLTFKIGMVLEDNAAAINITPILANNVEGKVRM